MVFANNEKQYHVEKNFFIRNVHTTGIYNKKFSARCNDPFNDFERQTRLIFLIQPGRLSFLSPTNESEVGVIVRNYLQQPIDPLLLLTA